ncbi:hypothetical protein QF023_001551 [Chryseobacterium sp. SLBN-27]|uniref:hypothetical protein n=1 Tax=Chryseobacterium sp. SLBN-27 TaxID=3042287 RepID=UPI00285F2CC7|nr:hypothetical protein [Chryseobacterium sp. SLBN-27]MDR6158035.1 hypothetical protein [Chryseobacterium sp. SLBN-27]
MKKIAFLFVLFMSFLNAQKLTADEISLINQGDVNTALPITRPPMKTSIELCSIFPPKLIRWTKIQPF